MKREEFVASSGDLTPVPDRELWLLDCLTFKKISVKASRGNVRPIHRSSTTKLLLLETELMLVSYQVSLTLELYLIRGSFPICTLLVKVVMLTSP